MTTPETFRSSTAQVIGAYGSPTTVMNHTVPPKYQRSVFQDREKTLQLVPESIRSIVENELKCFTNRPFRSDDLMTSQIVADGWEQTIYRIYIVDPVDENGHAFYQGQGYIPNMVIVKQEVGDQTWEYV